MSFAVLQMVIWIMKFSNYCGKPGSHSELPDPPTPTFEPQAIHLQNK